MKAEVIRDAEGQIIAYTAMDEQSNDVHLDMSTGDLDCYHKGLQASVKLPGLLVSKLAGAFEPLAEKEDEE